MNRLMALLVLAVLAGCANHAGEYKPMALRGEAYFRGQRVVPMNFPQIQSALFKHQAACGSAPKFALEPGQTSYATLTDSPSDSTDHQQTILVDLTYYRASDLGGWMAKAEDRDWNTRAKIYSYYAGADVEARIDQIFKAIAKPEECAQ